MGAGSSPGAGSGKPSSRPEGRRDVGRERIIDAALELFARQGYDATTMDQVVARAGVSPTDFERHFASVEAVLMSIADDMAYATAAELKNVARGTDPMRALLQAATSALGAVIEGRSELTLDRLLAMARIVTTTRNLHRKVSVGRKRVLNQPLAEWMGVDPEDRRLQHVLTMWSAVAASAYVNAQGLPDGYQPESDGEVHRTIIADVAQSFGEVMGDDPK
jgi:AcrR family transcriptional regulator